MLHTHNIYFLLRLFTVLFFSLYGNLFAQQDSVLRLVNEQNDNEKKITILLNACDYFSNKQNTYDLSQKAYKISLQTQNSDLTGQAASQLSKEFYDLGKYDSIKFYLDIAISKFKASGNNDRLFDALMKKSTFYKSQNKPEKAFEVYKELIGLAERSDNPGKIASVYYNMGGLFESINATDKASSYYNKALKLYTQVKNWQGIEDCYLSLGIINSTIGYYDLSIEYFERGLKIDSEKNSGHKRAEFLSGIGSVYFRLMNNEKALEYYKNALLIEEIKNGDNIIYLKNNIGVVLMDLGQYKEAKPYLIEAYFLTKNFRNKTDYAFNLAIVYKELNDYKVAMDYMDIYVRMNDSLNNALYSKNLSETEAKYQNEKKEEQNVLLSERLKRKSLQIYFALAGILLLSGLAFFIFRGLRQKNKANKALAEKNKIIHEKSVIVAEQHKDITDSIKYAQRIQKAILPPDRLWSSILPQSFVFYQPKDILSGDFYWIEETPEFIFLGAADCTGHGVPGALMSIVNYNLLNKAVLERGLTDAGAILDSVNRSLTQSLHQTFQESAVRDGMDISLCVINKNTKQMNFGGAYNSIYIIRNNEIKELIPDKQPVGAFMEDNIKPFTNQYYQLTEQDVVYMFTDGYADQFGGPKGKKYKYKNLQALLLENHNRSFSEQKTIVSRSINEWKGDLEQVDDILLLGFKLV